MLPRNALSHDHYCDLHSVIMLFIQFIAFSISEWLTNITVFLFLHLKKTEILNGMENVVTQTDYKTV